MIYAGAALGALLGTAIGLLLVHRRERIRWWLAPRAFRLAAWLAHGSCLCDYCSTFTGARASRRAWRQAYRRGWQQVARIRPKR